jgi:hypothetical protein
MENSATTPGRSSAPRVEERDRNIALACAVLLLIGMPIGWLPASTGDAIGLVALSLVSLGLMAWIVLRLLPRERAASRGTRTALILGVLAFLTVLVFWTGLPFAFGAGAVTLGLWARERAYAPDRGGPTTAAALGGLAVVLSFMGLLVG